MDNTKLHSCSLSLAHYASGTLSKVCIMDLVADRTDGCPGERCIYNALNDRMRNLLLSYDYSKSTDPLQPFAAHITSLLGREDPDTTDITISSARESFRLHKFILAARCPYFRKKLVHAPETTTFKLPSTIPLQAFSIALRHIYLAELPRDVGGGPGTGFSEEEVMEGLDRISTQLEIRSLWEGILDTHDRRQARQNRTSEISQGRGQLETWFRDNVLKHKVVVDTDLADEVKWDRNNAIFADVLLRADEEFETEDALVSDVGAPAGNQGIPIGPMETMSLGISAPKDIRKRTSVLFPAHRAMLLRADYFSGMFSSSFLEAQENPHLHIVTVDCTPDVLEWILFFLYAEKTDFPLDMALDLLFASDILFIDRLKSKAALVISTLGSGTLNQERSKLDSGGLATETTLVEDSLDPFEIMRAAWELRVPRLETFVARYFAYRLERYIDLPEFAELISESAARIKNRQETDSIEVIDDIRHYLSERFRLRFEGEGIAELLDEEAQRLAIVEESVREKMNDHEKETTDTSVIIDDSTIKNPMLNDGIRTLDGAFVSDEFESDALNYQLLLGKIEVLLERLDLDA